MLKFSISVPVGAYHALLPRCLESLARQRAPLAVSLLDASNDPRVSALADRYADVIAYRRHGADEGQSAAIIEGWRAAPGDILGWLNVDDILYPDALDAVLRRFLAHPNLDVAFGHSAVCDELMRMKGYHWAVSADPEDLRRGGSISQPSCFFTRTAYERVGGLNSDLHYTMDWDLWLRLLEGGARFSFVDQPLSMVYWGKGTKTATFGAQRQRELRRLVQRFSPPGERRRTLLGFATYAALDFIGSLGLRRLAQRRFGRNRAQVFGISSAGEIRSRAELRLFHLETTSKSRLHLMVHGGVRVTSPAERIVVQESGGGCAVAFDRAIPPATVVSLLLEPAAKGPVWFDAAEWR